MGKGFSWLRRWDSLLRLIFALYYYKKRHKRGRVSGGDAAVSMVCPDSAIAQGHMAPHGATFVLICQNQNTSAHGFIPTIHERYKLPNWLFENGHIRPFDATTSIWPICPFFKSKSQHPCHLHRRRWKMRTRWRWSVRTFTSTSRVFSPISLEVCQSFRWALNLFFYPWWWWQRWWQRWWWRRWWRRW